MPCIATALHSKQQPQPHRQRSELHLILVWPLCPSTTSFVHCSAETSSIPRLHNPHPNTSKRPSAVSDSGHTYNSEVFHVFVDLLIPPTTITPHNKDNLVMNVTCVRRAIQQQGEELGIAEHLPQFLSFRLREVVYELFASILVNIRGTNMNFMATFQLTKLGYFMYGRFLVAIKYTMSNFNHSLSLSLSGSLRKA